MRKEHNKWKVFTHEHKFNALDATETCHDGLRDQKSLRRRGGRGGRGGHCMLTIHAIMFCFFRITDLLAISA